MQTLHLFAGAGGGLLADLILGHRPIVAVEWNSHACSILRERSADGWFPELQVWEGDVREFDPSEYAGRVDGINAGFPCQDISPAGKGAGLGEGTRSGLYREVLRVADAIRPGFIFLENSSKITSRGVGRVYGDLAARGYEFRSICLRASDVGANHQRDRWWCLAKRMDDSDSRPRQSPRTDQVEAGPATAFNAAGQQSSSVPHANHSRLEWWQQQPSRSQQAGSVSNSNQQHDDTGRFRASPVFRKRSASPILCSSQSDVANTNSARTHRSWSSREQAGWIESAHGSAEMSDTFSQRLEGESQAGAATGTIDRSSYGCNSGWWEIEPNVGRVVNGVAPRSHEASVIVSRLKSIGNGQVPLQAAVAFRILEQLF